MGATIPDVIYASLLQYLSYIDVHRGYYCPSLLLYNIVVITVVVILFNWRVLSLLSLLPDGSVIGGSFSVINRVLGSTVSCARGAPFEVSSCLSLVGARSLKCSFRLLGWCEFVNLSTEHKVIMAK